MAKNGGFVYNRRCDYEPGYTHLRACVESSSWSDYPYDVNVKINEDESVVLDYECTCPAHSRYPGMCKHAAGLLLLYNTEPETFRGFTGKRAVSTSRSIANLMKRISTRDAASLQSREGNCETGSIYLELSLEYSRHERWGASFKIASPAASYVIKDIQEFLEYLESSAYHEYGKKMGFTHTADMFTAQGQKVIEWLTRTTNSTTGWWHRYEWQQGGSKRHIYLGAAQVIELLDIFQGQTISFSENEYYRTSKEWPMRVVSQNPDLSLKIEPLNRDGYQITRGAQLGIVTYRNRVYAWDDHRFYKCDSVYGECADFLQCVYAEGEEKLIVSDSDMPAFCRTLLPKLQAALQMDVPEELEKMKPLPLKIEFYLDNAPTGAECKAKALYGDTEYQLLDTSVQLGKPARDTAMEDAARASLKRYLPIAAEDFTAYTGSDDDMARLLFGGIEELQRYGEVFTTDAFDKKKIAKRPRVQTGLSLESNLINLSVSADELSPEDIAALLASYQGKKKYHKLKDGSFIDLQSQDDQDSEDLAKLEAIAVELGISLKDLASGMIELDPYNAFYLDSIALEEEKDASFKAFVESFEDLRNSKHVVPDCVADILRPYQVTGFEWLNMLYDTGLNGILADEMGLGKSLQVISLLSDHVDDLQDKPALIVCPASLVYNWEAEFKKFNPSISVGVLAGAKVIREELRNCGKHQVLVASYDTLRMDIESIGDQEFSFQIIDEAQYIKNHNTKAARAVKAINAAHRIALTGTPIENRLSELWSIFDYLMPGMLGPYKRFRDRYEAPILAGDDEMAKQLRSKVGPFILRRLKQDVLKDLPEKLETVIHAKLEPEQQTLYSAHEAQLRQSLAQSNDEEIKSGKIAVLAELTKLRQICCDPRLLYENFKGQGAKIDTICELVESAVDSGQKVLLFSQFTSFLELISKQLDQQGWHYYTITGATPKKQRMELVEEFNSNDVPVFLISLKAGGTGLNLVGASIVIHADPWWNAAAQNQATDRAHRIGQTRDVNVYKVIADGTIEERIVQLQEAKSDLADAILAADSASLGSLSRQELIELLTSE